MQTLSASPEAQPLTRIPWDFFGTLTFRGAVPTRSLQRKMWVAFVRYSERRLRLAEGRSLWVLRHEQGEHGHRDHFHFLWAGMPARYVKQRTCLVLMALAETRGFGISRVRVYDRNLEGVEYVMKGLSGENLYEVGRFEATEARTLTLSPGVRARLMRDRYGMPGIRTDRRFQHRRKETHRSATLHSTDNSSAA